MAGKAIDSSARGCLVIILPVAFLVAILYLAWPMVLALVVTAMALRIWQNNQWQKWSQQVNPFFHQLVQENQGALTAMDLAMKANLSGSAATRYLETKAEEFGAQRRDYEDRGTVYYFVTSRTLGSILDDSETSLYESEPPTEEVIRASQAIASNLKSIVDDSESIQSESSTQEVTEPQKLTVSNLKNIFDDSEPTEIETSTQEDIEPQKPSSSNFKSLFDDSEPPDIYDSSVSVNEEVIKNSTANVKQEPAASEKPIGKDGLIQSELAKRLDVHSSTIFKRRSEPYFSEWSRGRDPQGIAWKYSRKSRLFFPVE